MKCPKCQVENIPGAEFCRGCGNKLEVVCPKCGFKQTYAGACAKCGIVFSKFKEKHPIEEKRYKIRPTVLLFIKCLIAGFFILVGLLIYYRNSVPAGIDAAVIISIFFIVCGIVCIFVYIQAKAYFVSLTEKSLNIAGRQIIPWEDIYNVDWHDVEYDCYGIPMRQQWIDIYASDQVNEKIVNIRISNWLEEFEGLYKEIMKRVISDIDGLKDHVETNIRMLVEWGAWLTGLLIIFLLIVASPEGEIFIFIKSHPRLSIMIGIIFLITGILLIFRWRE
jgi:hypothetical protein